jgi:Uncharacterized alpha/beta hydrolase domain (DUF2235)
VLVGFSRGAFTVRSVAGMIGQLGLLTREGIENFYPIFKDMENWMNEDYDDPFPTIPFENKPQGKGAADEYRKRLVKVCAIHLQSSYGINLLFQLGYAREREDKGRGKPIKIKAIGKIFHLPSISYRY